MSKYDRNVGRIDVSYELLSEWLALPQGTDIRTVLAGETYGQFSVIVNHPDLDPVPPGGQVPLVDYTVTREVIEGRFNA